MIAAAHRSEERSIHADAVARPVASDFAIALRDAIADRGISLAALSRRLRDSGNPLSVATLSCWQSGSRRPEGANSLAALDELEHLLQVPTGALAEQIGRTRRSGRRPLPRAPCTDWDREAPILETMRHFGIDPHASLHTRSVHALCRTDGQGRVRRIDYRAVLEPPPGSPMRVPYIDLPGRVTDVWPILTPRRGCRVTQRHAHPSGTAFGTLLTIDAPEDQHCTAMIEFSVRYPLPYPRDRVITYASLFKTREVLLHVDFGTAPAPTWIEEVALTNGEQRAIPLTRTPTTATSVRAPFPPGLLAIRWGYGPRTAGADPLPGF